MDTLHRMFGLLRSMEQQSDGRTSFLRCYSLMSQNMLTGVDQGEFHDSQWMRHFVDHFADYYFRSLEEYDAALPTTPKVWSLAHDIARQDDRSILQKLLLGINAHINYDLVLTLVDLLDAEWNAYAEEQRTLRFKDYCHVNEIIGQTVDAVQDLVLEAEEPGLEILDISLGPIDEWLISKLIYGWRDQVWSQAVHFLENPDQTARQELREQLESRTVARGEAILFKKGVRSLLDLW